MKTLPENQGDHGSIAEAFGNPKANIIAAGLTAEQLSTAIRESGYPLQIDVATRLAKHFDEVEHEWSYVDESSAKVRAIDIHVMHREYFPTEDHHVYPEVNLLVECKRSEMPLIFFLVEKDHFGLLHPRVAGVSRQEAALTTEYKGSSRFGTLFEVLGLEELPILRPKNVCFTFSKAARSGKRLELSGSDV